MGSAACSAGSNWMAILILQSLMMILAMARPGQAWPLQLQGPAVATQLGYSLLELCTIKQSRG
jgi:hypothetical protein